MNNIFVGNLSFSATKEDIQKLFEPFGTVANVTIMERKKGKSRGYGFVDMPNEEEKNKAIEGLEGKEFMYRVLSVSVVAPKVKGEFRPKKFKSEPKPTKPWFKNQEEEGEEKPYYNKESKPTGNPRREDKPWIKRESGSSRSQGAPYRRDDRESKPYRKDDGNSRSSREDKPYNKFKSNSNPSSWGKPKPYGSSRPAGKPWIKKEGGDRPAGGKFSHRPDDREDKPKAYPRASSPYRRDDREGKPAGHSKPWSKGASASKPSYKKFDGAPKKPWAKSEGVGKSPSQSGGAFKMFHKVSKLSKHVSRKGEARS